MNKDACPLGAYILMGERQTINIINKLYRMLKDGFWNKQWSWLKHIAIFPGRKHGSREYSFLKSASEKKGATSHEVNSGPLFFFKIREIILCLYAKGEEFEYTEENRAIIGMRVQKKWRGRIHIRRLNCLSPGSLGKKDFYTCHLPDLPFPSSPPAPHQHVHSLLDLLCGA